MDNNIKNILHSIGLDEKQTSIYIALLSTLQLKATEIAKMTKINRSSIYRHTENLLKLKLIKEELIDGYTHFSITNTDRITELFAIKEEKLNNIKKSLHTVINKLKEINIAPLSYTKYYYNKKQIINRISMVYSKSKFFYLYENKDLLLVDYPKVQDLKIIPKNIMNNISIKIITNISVMYIYEKENTLIALEITGEEIIKINKKNFLFIWNSHRLDNYQLNNVK